MSEDITDDEAQGRNFAGAGSGGSGGGGSVRTSGIPDDYYSEDEAAFDEEGLFDDDNSDYGANIDA